MLMIASRNLIGGREVIPITVHLELYRVYFKETQPTKKSEQMNWVVYNLKWQV